MLNLVIVVIGAVFLIYGIRQKLKFWIVVGAAVLALGLISVGMDYLAAGAAGDTNAVNYRLPFVIGRVMK